MPLTSRKLDRLARLAGMGPVTIQTRNSVTAAALLSGLFPLVPGYTPPEAQAVYWLNQSTGILWG